VRAALEEDIGSGDLTTQIIVEKGARGTARVISRSDGILSGCAPFLEVFHQLDESIKIKFALQDAETLRKDNQVAELTGPIAPILTGERTALNFLQRLSGIATLTGRYVDRVKGTKAQILDTRKTTPLMRALEKAAVRHGGGNNHRKGLYDMILIKENHESAASGITAALSRVAIAAERIAEPAPVEVEVQNLDQLDEILQHDNESRKFRPDRILLDNFTLEMIESAMRKVAGWVPLEVSGGIDLDNVRRVAALGVDFISVGALTHSAPSLDFTLLLTA